MGKQRETKPLPVVGVYAFCSTGSGLVHRIEGDRVLASVNGKHPEWCEITENWNDDTEEWESGFFIKPGSFFVPFSQVMRTDV